MTDSADFFEPSSLKIPLSPIGDSMFQKRCFGVNSMRDLVIAPARGAAFHRKLN
jgi:hypothetical protein